MIEIKIDIAFKIVLNLLLKNVLNVLRSKGFKHNKIIQTWGVKAKAN